MNNVNGKPTLCMGELLIDMIQTDEPMTFKAHPGGAPANVAVGISRLGGRSAFMGKVGQDNFGNFLDDTLKGNNVDTRGLKRGGKTAVALVSLDENGERSFSFYEELANFTEQDMELKIIDDCSIFHFGSISLINKSSSLATQKCLRYAKSKEITISYDPNLRLNLWGSPMSAREGIQVGMEHANILKISDEELEFLTGRRDAEKGMEKILEMGPHLKAAAVTLGEKGCYCYYNGQGEYIPTARVNVVDTTGAGDGFMAGLLYAVAGSGGIDNMDWSSIRNACRFGNAVGTLTTTNKGAITALPTMNEVKSFCAERNFNTEIDNFLDKG